MWTERWCCWILAPVHSARALAGCTKALAAQGIAPEQISLVLLSHAHADHIGGLLDGSGRPAFPNARIVIARQEFEFWHDSGIRDRLGSGSVYGNAMIESVIREWFDRYLVPLKDRLDLVESDAEVMPGVRMVPAPGHTPGHCAILISGGGDPVLFTADAFALPDHISHPEWTSSFDLDAEQTVRTRHQSARSGGGGELPCRALPRGRNRPRSSPRVRLRLGAGDCFGCAAWHSLREDIYEIDNVSGLPRCACSVVSASVRGRARELWIRFSSSALLARRVSRPYGSCAREERGVRALIRDAAQAPRFLALGVEPVQGDLTDSASLRRACEGVAVVLCTATAAAPTRSADTFEAVERDGYRSLVEIAAAARVQRFVYTSVLPTKYTRLSRFFNTNARPRQL